MGRLVEAVALREGWEVGPKLESRTTPGAAASRAESMAGVDVAIEFSQPDAVFPNIEAAARAGVNLVVGHHRMGGGAAAWSGWCGSPGSAWSMRRIFGRDEPVLRDRRPCGQVVGRLPQYEPYIVEEHHRAKKDAPSGTALSLLELMRPYLGGPQLGIACDPGRDHARAPTSSASTARRTRSSWNTGRAAAQGFAEGADPGRPLDRRAKKGFYDFRDVFREIHRSVTDRDRESRTQGEQGMEPGQTRKS